MAQVWLLSTINAVTSVVMIALAMIAFETWCDRERDFDS